MGRGHDAQAREGQFIGTKVALVVADDAVGAARHGQLDKVVVALVTQVRPPAEVDACPATVGHKDVEQLVAFTLPFAPAHRNWGHNDWGHNDLMAIP